ncbi:MAG: transcriptional repressor [Deltaproteobacteria bacterium]|nr:MAG: transcriptional repressor [Deltaproteobacteria bacterium]
MLRKTEQREAIRRVFQENHDPLSVQDVLDKAQQDVPRLGIATVYRTLKALVDEGWLKVVELPGDTSRYERTGKGHHHHFSCNKCERVFDLEGCLPGIDTLLPPGFLLQSHEFFLYGVCADCAA